MEVFFHLPCLDGEDTGEGHGLVSPGLALPGCAEKRGKSTLTSQNPESLQDIISQINTGSITAGTFCSGSCEGGLVMGYTSRCQGGVLGPIAGGQDALFFPTCGDHAGGHSWVQCRGQGSGQEAVLPLAGNSHGGGQAGDQVPVLPGGEELVLRRCGIYWRPQGLTNQTPQSLDDLIINTSAKGNIGGLSCCLLCALNSSFKSSNLVQCKLWLSFLNECFCLVSVPPKLLLDTLA